MRRAPLRPTTITMSRWAFVLVAFCSASPALSGVQRDAWVQERLGNTEGIEVTVSGESERRIDLIVESAKPEISSVKTREGFVSAVGLHDLSERTNEQRPPTRAGWSDISVGGAVPMRRVLVRIPSGVDVHLRSSTVDVSTIQSPFTNSVFADLARRLAVLEYTGWLRNVRVASILVYPVVQASQPGFLEHAAKGRITLELSPTSAPEAADRSHPIDVPWFDSVYRGALLNPPVQSLRSNGGRPLMARPRGAAPQALQSGPVITSAVPRSDIAAAPAPNPLGWRIKVESIGRGIFALGHADLVAAGIVPDSFAPSSLRLTRHGASVPIHVAGGSDGRFDSSDKIYFFSEGTETRYSRNSVWWLDLAHGLGQPPPLRMAAVDATPSGASSVITSGRHTVRVEENDRYWSFMPNPGDHDRWYWTRAQAPATHSIPVHLDDPVPGGANAVLRAFLHGFTNAPQSPDHHTTLAMNGLVVSDATWDGITPFVQSASVPASALNLGANVITVAQIDDTGAVVDTIYTDRYELEYSRSLLAAGNELEWRSPAQTPAVEYAIDRFASTDVLALDVTVPSAPVRLEGVVMSPSLAGQRGTFSYASQLPTTFYVAAADSARAPVSIERVAAPPAAPPLGSDLVIVASRAYWPTLAPLVQARQQSGLRVSLHAPEDLYDAYTFGELDPDAIRLFLTDAYAHWSAPAPSYVLLVGEASYDFKDYTGHGTPNTAPGQFFYSAVQGQTVSDHLHVRVVGNDPLPDMFIGRWPAINASEVAQLVSNALAYEAAVAAGGPWTSTAIHTADFGGLFTGSLNTAASFLPSTFTVHNAFADQLGSKAATRAEIVARLNAGAAILTFLGHGSVTTWSGSIMNASSVAPLANGDRLPVVTALNCLNGHFAIPSPHRSLSEEFMLAPNGGAIANVAPSGLAYLWELNHIIERFYVRYGQGDNLGQTYLGSLLDAYTTRGIHEENLVKMVLFGDPTLEMH